MRVGGSFDRGLSFDDEGMKLYEKNKIKLINLKFKAK